MLALAQIAWGVDPVLVRVGPVAVRWYSLLFAAAFLGGWGLWNWQMRRLGASPAAVAAFLPLGFVAAVAGARLGECLLYQLGPCLEDPWRVLRIRQGGLSSHGAAAGLMAALYLFARRTHTPFAEAMDCLAPASALGAGLVRVGNLFNSEVVGRPAALPWAFRFVRHDGGAVPRHPVQLYEAALAFGVLGALLLVDRRLGERRPRWLLAGLFLGLYFGGRLLVEPFKETPRLAPWLPLGMGQAASIPLALAGLAMLATAARAAGGRRSQGLRSP